MKGRYFSANEYFRQIFGEKVYRISIDAGFSCPNRDGTKGTGGCIYCNAGGSKASYVNSSLPVEKQLEEGISLIKKSKGIGKFIAYFQPFSNTYASLERLKGVYKPALSHPDVVGISIGTRPDCVDDEKLNYLNEIGKEKFVMLEYGVQTLNDRALNFINRGHNSKTSIEAIIKTKKRENIKVLVHLIFLLPLDDLNQMLDSIKRLVELGIDGVKFHHLYVEKNTPLEKLYLEGKVVVLKREEYFEMLTKAISILPEKVVIHRLFGECDRENLVAPEWTNEKTKNINLFNKYIEEKDIFQGKFFS
ncbi:MAG: TIGR01212 family radical SAM protein [Brevinematia bacterium]